MLNRVEWIVILAVVVAGRGSLFGGEVVETNWPEYRGPHADGVSGASGLPIRWGEASNLKWKTPIPGRGYSTPVIWGRQVWMTTAIEPSEDSSGDPMQLLAVCVGRDSGEVIRVVRVFDVDKPVNIHELNSHASPSPGIEPGRVYVHFGTYGTAAIDTTTGDVLWMRRDLTLNHSVGPGSSPVLYENLLIFNCDGRDTRYVIALDKRNGRTAWRTERSNDVSHKEPPMHKAFSTPILIRHGGEVQLVSTGAHAVMGYEPLTGREIWQIRYEGFSNVPRPIFGNGLIFINTGYVKPQLMAIRPGGSGDVTDSHVAWTRKRTIPKKPSPLLVDGMIYQVTDNGIATCIEAKNGETVWEGRLEGEYTASPLYADGRVYYFNHDGKTTVVRAGGEFEVLAENRLDGDFMASPAVSGRALFLRTKTHLCRVEAVPNP